MINRINWWDPIFTIKAHIYHNIYIHTHIYNVSLNYLYRVYIIFKYIQCSFLNPYICMCIWIHLNYFKYTYTHLYIYDNKHWVFLVYHATSWPEEYVRFLNLQSQRMHLKSKSVASPQAPKLSLTDKQLSIYQATMKAIG